MKVGVIGLGNFGHFAAGMLGRQEDLDVVAYDVATVDLPQDVKKVGLAEVAQADVIVLCIPLSAYTEFLLKLRPLLRPESLVVDICSVKVEANRRLRDLLPDHKNLLITHPMFGSMSAGDGLEGHTLIVTDALGELAERAVRYCQEQLGLKVARITNEEHDQAMAEVHALTFFIARGLTKIGLVESPFQTPTFQMLHQLAAFDQAHSEDLFRTIELGNPYAHGTRERVLRTFAEINDELKKESV